MTERLLFDLMGDLDFGLLENDYMEHDLLMQQKAQPKKKWFQMKAKKTGNDHAVFDSLRNAVYGKRELIDTFVAQPIDNEEGHITEKIENNVKKVKSKLHKALTVVSGVAAVIAVAVSIVKYFAKKKVFHKQVQTA